MAIRYALRWVTSFRMTDPDEPATLSRMRRPVLALMRRVALYSVTPSESTMVTPESLDVVEPPVLTMPSR